MTLAALAPIERRLRERVFAPPPRLSLPEWADTYAYVHVGAEKGRWRTDRAPYQRGIMEAISDPAIPEVVWMKSARTGYTELITKAIARHAHIDPCETLVVQPDQFTAERWSRTYLAPEFRDTPALQGLVSEFAEGGARHSGNTILRKEYPGGDVTCVWASSANRLRFSTNRLVIFDEIDGYPPNKEGDPIKLGEKRAETYGRRRKVIKGSSPTIKGFSRIERAFLQSDQRFYHVPCPDCGHKQRLVWANVRWDEGKPETAAYACEGCGSLIPHHRKQQMLRGGAWVRTAPEHRICGFHISALYSPWVTWEAMAVAFLDAQGNAERLQSFVNTFLGETWEERGDSFRAEGILARRETYERVAEERWPCPAGVNVITSATDVQGDRIETLWVGWGKGRECWPLRHEVFLGNPDTDANRPGVWRDLDLAAADPWVHGSGEGRLGLACGVVDSGYLTQAVYAYTGPRYGRRWYAVKGNPKGDKGLVKPRPSVDDRSGARFFLYQASTAKDALFSMLRVQVAGPRYIHFPEWFTQEHADQLTAEKLVRKVGRDGSVKRMYVKTQDRNEILDLFVMNMVALSLSRRDPERPAALIAASGAVADPGATDDAPVESDETQDDDAFTPGRRVVRVARTGSGWINGIRRS